MMRSLRIFYVLCTLCVVCTLGSSLGKIDQSDHNVTSSQESSESRQIRNASYPRDKRALGLILSGLAQVFGYTVNPVQVASLPNPNSTEQGNGGNQSPPNASSNSTQSSTAATPRQRETIRFTGVVNFGNGTGILNHLQEYERIFHGGNNSSGSMTTSAPTPSIDPRTPNSGQSPFSPLLVNIPLPTVPEISLPAVPQSPLPEIPPLDLNISYPKPYVSVNDVQESAYGKNEANEKFNVESKEVQNARDASTQRPRTRIDEQSWKKEYEDRLAELERKQEEHAKRLREQEFYRSREKDDSLERNEQYKNQGKLEFHRTDPVCKEKDDERQNDGSDEKNDAGEIFEDPKKSNEYSFDLPAKDSRESEEEKYQDYDDESLKQDKGLGISNYSSVRYNEPLPISDDNEQRRPEELRNSYGELLNSSELIEDGFGSYFGKFRPQNDFHTSSEIAGAKESVKEGGFYEENNEEDSEEEREEYNLPARNRYEEYNLEDDTDTRRKDVTGSKDTFKPFTSNESHSEDRRSDGGSESGKYMPLLVPVRYLDAPEELRKTKERSSTSEKSNKNNMSSGEAIKKASSKQSRKSNKENLKSKASTPGRASSSKLHEGEQPKELQMWPAPFDFVLDSTIQTGVLPGKSRRKIEASRKQNKETERGKQGADDVSGKRDYDYSENNYYRFLENLKSRAASGEQTSREPVNLDASNYTNPRNKEVKIDPYYQYKEDPSSWERYKYSSTNNNRNENGNVEAENSDRQISNSVYLKKFEPLKRSNEKTERVAGHAYSGTYPTEGREDFRFNSQKPVQMAAYDNNGNAKNLFPFGTNDYDFNYGQNSGKSFRMFDGEQKIGNGGDVIGLAVPQSEDYRYDESLTKFASEPESKSVRVVVGDYFNRGADIRVIEPKQVNPNGPITYVNFAHNL